MLRYFCFLAVILGVKSASAPFIKPCNLAEHECVVASARAALPIVAPGIPELGMKSLDPMELQMVRSDQAGMHLTFRNTIITGMKGCHVDDIKSDQVKLRQTVIIRCDVTLKGDYTLGGSLLLLPVQGEGPYVIKIRDIIIKAAIELDNIEGPDGKKHLHIKAFKDTYKVKTSTVFKFDNLFNGNKVLADPITAFMNANWKDVMEEVAGPIVHAIVSNVVDSVQALYKAVPADELVLD